MPFLLPNQQCQSTEGNKSKGAKGELFVISGVLLKMEVGIRKGRGEGPEGTLLIYDHWGEYTLSKKSGGWYTPYTRIYPPNTPLFVMTCMCNNRWRANVSRRLNTTVMRSSQYEVRVVPHGCALSPAVMLNDTCLQHNFKTISVPTTMFGKLWVCQNLFGKLQSISILFLLIAFLSKQPTQTTANKYRQSELTVRRLIYKLIQTTKSLKQYMTSTRQSPSVAHPLIPIDAC